MARLLLTVLAVFVGMAGAAAAQTPAPQQRCVSLDTAVTTTPALPEILRVELGGLGITLREDPSPEEGTGCVHVRVRRLAEDAVIIELEGDQSRVVDLAPIGESLRARSLALAITEELNSASVDAPALRPAPDPNLRRIIHIREPVTRRRAASPPRHGVSALQLVASGGVEHAFDSAQTLAALRLGLETQLAAGKAGRLRIGVEFPFGNQASARFGDIGILQLGGYLSWHWRVLSGGDFALDLLPEVGLGATLLKGQSPGSSTVDDRNHTAFYLRTAVAAFAQWQLTSGVALEAGPVFGVFPIAPELIADGKRVAGVVGIYLGGRLGLVVGL